MLSIYRQKEVGKDVSVVFIVHLEEDMVKKMHMDAGFRNVIGIFESIRVV